MKQRDSEQLLSGVLGDERLDDVRQASLEFGLTALRKRQRHRRIAKTCAIMSIPIVLIVLFYNVIAPAPNPSALAPGPLISAGTSPNDEVKFIDDEQLFALFPNRPIALVGKPGHQQLVFLDQMTAEYRPVAR